MQRVCKLQELSEVRSGYSFRGKIKSDVDGTHYVIQLKDADIEGNIVTSELIKTILPGRAPSQLVEEGDILFVARGNHNYAFCTCDIKEPTVPSQHFFHLRLSRPDMVVPDYLTWIINQPKQQRYLDKSAVGTSLRSIRRVVLEEMPISLPSIVKQKEILEVLNCHKREKQLTQQLMKNSEKLTNTIINKILEQEV